MADPVSWIVEPIISKGIDTCCELLQERINLDREVKEDVEKMKSNLTAIQAVLKHNKTILDEPSKDWLGKLQDVAFDAQDVLGMFATESFLWKRKQAARSFRWPVSKTKYSYTSTAGREIKGILKRLEQINEEKIKIIGTVGGHGSSTDDRNSINRMHRASHSTSSSTNICGRETEKEKIINDLIMPPVEDDDHHHQRSRSKVSVYPIVGMAGVGKTTLAQLIYNDDKIKQHFELGRMWVSVSTHFNLTRILKLIIQSYSDMDDTAGISEDMVTFRIEQLLPGKRFLLVLDDVWTDNYQDWEPLLKILEYGKEGSKVLVTSRIQRIADILIPEKSPYCKLDCLPEEECLPLFQNIAFVNQNISGELEEISKGIVEKCKGLPLAVKAMASLLRGNVDVDKWKRIQRSDLVELEDKNSKTNTPNILPILKMSYNTLPSHLQQCFVFCSIFPKGHNFDKKELVKLWVALDFIQSTEHVSAEENGDEYFDDLQGRCFFEPLSIDDPNKKKGYIMHDLIHDLALEISGPHYTHLKDGVSSCSEKWRHVSFLCKDIDKPCEDVAVTCKKLRTLLMPGPADQSRNVRLATLDKLFRSLRYIRVLDLSSSNLLELPPTIGACKLLRYLDLSRTEIKQLPNSICKLYNLQTLKLLGCLWLFSLPEDLGNLVNLCHLELDDLFWFKCTTLPPKIGNLTKLQDWHAFKVHRKTGYEIEELKDMKHLTRALHILGLENSANAVDAKLSEKEGLQKVVLEWTSGNLTVEDKAAQAKVLQDLQPHSGLKDLQINHYGGIDFPYWMSNGRLRELVVITLKHCTNCSFLLLGQQPNLRELRMKGLLELERWQDVVDPGHNPFPFLSRLTISNCPKLLEVPSCLIQLRALKIKKCNSLQALPLMPFLQFLILADNLNLENWNERTIRYVTPQGCIQTSSFLQLLEMKISNCPKLVGLPQFFPQKLEISGCELVTTLPGQDFARRLQHLALDTRNNGELIREIPNSDSLYSLVISNISNLDTLPSHLSLPGLKALYVHNCEDLVSLSGGEGKPLRSFTSLTLLSVRGCPKVETLLDEGIIPSALECLSVGSCSNLQFLCREDGTLRSLSSLKDLYIEDCPRLQSFPDDGLPDSLEHLCIKSCPLLNKQCQMDVGQEWQKIKDIPDLEIDTGS